MKQGRVDAPELFPAIIAALIGDREFMHFPLDDLDENENSVAQLVTGFVAMLVLWEIELVAR